MNGSMVITKKHSAESNDEILVKIKDTQKKRIFDVNDIREHLEELTEDGKYQII